MKSYLWTLACLSLSACCLCASADTPRTTLPLAEGWRFYQGDAEGAQQPGFNDTGWERVRVPHDWSIAGRFEESNPARGEGGFLPTGVAWYRKGFQTPEDLGGKRMFVEFDGVMSHSEVWINGHRLGRRPNGYVSFRYELTDHVRREAGAENLIAVRTDTSEQVASRWYTGSGIYRSVRLVIVAPVHIDYNGVFVATPNVSAEAASVACTLSVVNKTSADQEVAVLSTILSPQGDSIQAVETKQRVPAGETVEVASQLELVAPLLWGVESPTLYTMQNQVSVSGVVTDSVTTPFGVRKAEFRADTGFWLNGKNLKIKGVCLHHCAGALGAAVPLSLWEYRLERLQELGVNAIRTAHNPVAPEVLSLCDRMGVLVMDEFFDCWKVGKRRADYHHHFSEWSHKDMRDTILRDRNHPSVIMYSVGNEIHDTPREEQAKRILAGLVDVCHKADPTRPVTQALFRPNVSHDYDNGLADMLDVIGTNYRDLELLQAHRDDPTRKIIGTEQSHDRRIWLACRDNPQHAGQFLWVGIDYLGESRRWPVTTFNSGLLDRTGRPHPRAYERQSWWSEKPMVHAFRRIAATESTPTDPGYEAVEWRRRQVLFSDWTPRNDEPHRETIEVYSNCEEVELLLNGNSLGEKSLPQDARPRTWRAPFEPGVLVAVAKNGGREVARHELRTAGPADRVELRSSRQSVLPEWDDVTVVEARVTDARGTRVPRSNLEITFKVEGPGEIVAVDNGSIVSHEPFHASRRRAYQGQCIAIIRAVSSEGPIRVTAHADSLESGGVSLRTSR